MKRFPWHVWVALYFAALILLSEVLGRSRLPAALTFTIPAVILFATWIWSLSERDWTPHGRRRR
jgi:hypothetical protein